MSLPLRASAPLHGAPPALLTEAASADTASSPSTLAYGRYLGPIGDPRLESVAPALARKLRRRRKRWHYLSVRGEEFFLGLAVIDLGYLANAFVYLVEPAATPTDTLHAEYRALAPRLVRPVVSFAPSSVMGRTVFERGPARIEIASASTGWALSLDVPLRRARERRSVPLRAELTLDPPAETLGLLCPLPSDRPAYTHKATPLSAAGTLSFGEREYSLTGALGASDWTLTYAERVTRWRWASVATRDAQGRLLGLNLSGRVYDDDAGESLENVCWADGALHPLRGVAFDIPDDPKSQHWHITSATDDSIDLRFVPLGVRAEDVNLGLVASRFVQPFGTFVGHVCGRQLDGAFGVVEDHHARW